MMDINKKIRNGIANSYHLRELAKDNKITQKTKDRLYQQAKENDKKILFYKRLSNALKEAQKEDIAVKSK